MSEKPVRLARSVIYKCPWVNVYVDKVQFPGGRIVEQHHFLDFENDVVAIIIENSRGDILFIRSYRYITDSVDWEIPGGSCDDGEAVLDAARREAFEETGYEISDLKVRYSFHPMNGIANQVQHIVYGKVAGQTGEFDRNEVQTVTWFTPAEVQCMIRNQTLKDGLTLTAMLLHLSGGFQR